MFGRSLHNSFHDQTHLAIVMVAITLGAGVASRGDASTGCLIGKIAADLGGEFVEAGKEDRLLVLPESIHVPLRPFGEQKSPATRDLEALMDELVLIGVSDEAKVDLRPPDSLAILLLVEFALAVKPRKSVAPRERAAMPAGYLRSRPQTPVTGESKYLPGHRKAFRQRRPRDRGPCPTIRQAAESGWSAHKRSGS